MSIALTSRGRPLFRRSLRAEAKTLCFRRLLVGPAGTISLAKPSKPADEENFAPLRALDSNRLGRGHARTGDPECACCCTSEPAARLASNRDAGSCVAGLRAAG